MQDLHKQIYLVTKIDLDTKLSSLNRKITSNKTRYLLIKNEISYYRGKNYFDEDGTQTFLVFIPISKYFKVHSVIGVIIMHYHGNLKDYLVKVLKQFLHLIIVSHQH